MSDRLSKKQAQALLNGIECDGETYYFLHYTSPDAFEKKHGKLPRDVRKAWVDFRRAHDNLTASIDEIYDMEDLTYDI